jgi:alkaline phosphatase D
MTLSRREFVQVAAAMGASLAWGGTAKASRTGWREARQLYPEGVASGDPDPNSVILWTRRPFEKAAGRQLLTVEVATDEAFRKVVAKAPAPVSAEADWTARVLVGGLKPSHSYWYRFTDAQGNGSRVGRTRTAPRPNDPRPVKFAFVSCQDLNEGTLNAYRRMIFEDERAAPADQLDFVLHLGDFIYEVVEYPDEVKTRYDRIIYDVGRIPNGGKVGHFHFPLTVDGYRTVYRGYLADLDLQDARARWPFVAIWDNHEFSWQGWQSIQKAGKARPGQSIKVAANQAWWEYLPSRCKKSGGTSWEHFEAPAVQDVEIKKWDKNGLGDEPNNLIAINSLIGYRTFRYGKHLDLIITDQHSFHSADPFSDDSLNKLADWGAYDGWFPEDLQQVLDGGRAFNGGNPPAELAFGDARIANPQKDAPPQTILGADQKAWLKDQLKRATATWKIWGNSQGAIDERIDPQNLPAGMLPKPWPSGFVNASPNDYGCAWTERGEIYDLVRDAKITGFAIVSGDRHSFWAGYATSKLPPEKFEPVGLSFVGGSLSSAGAMEALEHRPPEKFPLRKLYLVDRPGSAKPDWTYNMLLRHGVRSVLEYASSFDLNRARALSNADLSPHLEFVDAGGHGYATVRLTGDEMRTEFVCIPRPVTRSASPDGGPLRYRVAHVAKLWRPGERPRLTTSVLEGDPGLSI